MRTLSGSRRVMSIVSGLALATVTLSIGSSPAAAGRGVTLEVRPVIIGSNDVGCGQWGFDLALVSLRGDRVGDAHVCADEISEINRAGNWRLLIVGHAELQLQGGSASGPVQWDRQNWIPENGDPEVIERFRALLTEGTGAYSGLTGSISGGGVVQWDGEEPVDETLWTITMH